MPEVACSAHTPRKQRSALMPRKAVIVCAPTATIARGSSVPPTVITSSPGWRPSAAATGGLWVTNVPVWPGGIASTRCSAVLPPSRITTWPGSSSAAAARATASLPSTAWTWRPS